MNDVVAVAAGDALGGAEVVVPLEFDAADFLRDGHQFVDRDHLIGAEIDGRGDQLVAVHDLVDAEDAVVDEHEAAGLAAVAPDGDLAAAAVLGLDDLATDRRRRLFPAAIPGTPRAIDIVKAGDRGLEAPLGGVFLTKHLRHQLFPAVAAFGHRRVSVGFLQRRAVRVFLQRRVVGAGRRGVEISLGPGPPGALDQMRVDQDAPQALDAEPLDETHAAHVRGQVIDLDGALAGPLAVVLFLEVHAQALDARHPLVPFGQRLFVDRADPRESLVVEVSRQGPGDESAGAGDDDLVILVERRLGQKVGFLRTGFLCHIRLAD